MTYVDDWKEAFNLTTGLYRDVPFVDYLKLGALSKSKLKTFIEDSPAHSQVPMSKSPQQQANFDFGSLCHDMLFTPEMVESGYAFLPRGVTKSHKEGKEFYEEHAGKVILTDYKKHQAGKVVTAVQSHPDAKKYLDKMTEAELSVTYYEDEIYCKSRFDALCPGSIIDLKTSYTAHPKKFGAAFWKFGYHIQDYLYRRAAEYHNIDVQNMVFIAVEKEPPFGVSVHVTNDETYRIAKAIIYEHLQSYKECHASGKWPNYQTGIFEIEPPQYLAEKYPLSNDMELPV